MSSLLGRLSSSAIAILPAPLQYRALQRQQILELGKGCGFEKVVELDQSAREELHWWVQNLRLSNGKRILLQKPQLVISSDASMKGWGAFCQGQRTGGPWSMIEKKDHINILEMKAAKFALMTFVLRFPRVKAVHLQMDNMVALAYLSKMGGTKNQLLTLLSNPKIFQKICQARWTPSIDLFASRVSHQLPAYMSWKLDPFSKGRDAFQVQWTEMEGYAFPPFSLITRVLKKVQVEFATVLLITPVWQTQPWYPKALEMSIKNPILIPKQRDLLLNPDREAHSLVESNSLQLAVWAISGKVCLQRAFQQGLQNLSQIPEEEAHCRITNRPGESLVAGVVREKLIPFNVL